MSISTEKYEKLKYRAAYALKKAIVIGHILPASQYSCVDCGKKACCYDHRDYEKPLDVAPVCKSCNTRRGCAINASSEMKQRISMSNFKNDGGDHDGGLDELYCFAPLNFEVLDNHIFCANLFAPNRFNKELSFYKIFGYSTKRPGLELLELF